jgi:SAM-dependent methyltransferase
MEGRNETAHWEGIYAYKASEELGWYQEIPGTSLEWIERLNLPLSARILDAGGGDSRLVDFLLDKGYRNITVLDISKNALQRARKRLGEKAGLVEWIYGDVRSLEGDNTYDLWHDRACFHFLLGDDERERYRDLVMGSLKDGGHFILGSFSKEGPKRCSGLDIRQNSEEELAELFSGLQLLESAYLKHYKPSGNLQNYIFCTFQKK